MLGINPVYIWLAALIVFAILEAATVGLVSIWFALGALAGMIAALLGSPIWLQVVLFLVVSAILIALLRPLTDKYITPKKTRMNADRHIGRICLVQEEIDDLHDTGAVKLDGVIWTARTGTSAVIPFGATVKVLELQGAKLLVEQVYEEATL